MVESHNNTERLILLHFSWFSDIDISFIQVITPLLKVSNLHQEENQLTLEYSVTVL